MVSTIQHYSDFIQRQHEEKQKGKEKVGEDSVDSRVWFGAVVYVCLNVYVSEMLRSTGRFWGISTGIGTKWMI